MTAAVTILADHGSLASSIVFVAPVLVLIAGVLIIALRARLQERRRGGAS